MLQPALSTDTEYQEAMALLEEHRHRFVHETNSRNSFDKNNLNNPQIKALVSSVPKEYVRDFAKLLVSYFPFLSNQQLTCLMRSPHYIARLQEIYDSVLVIDRRLSITYSLPKLVREIRKEWIVQPLKEYAGLEEFITTHAVNGKLNDEDIFQVITLLLSLNLYDILVEMVGERRARALDNLYRNRDFHHFPRSQVVSDNRNYFSRYTFETFSAVLRVDPEHAYELSKLLIVFPHTLSQRQIDHLCEYPQHVSYLWQKTIDPQYGLINPSVGAYFDKKDFILMAGQFPGDVAYLAQALHWLQHHGIDSQENKWIAAYKIQDCDVFARLPRVPLTLADQDRDLNQIIFATIMDYSENKSVYVKKENFHSFFTTNMGASLALTAAKNYNLYRLIKRETLKSIYDAVGMSDNSFFIADILSRPALREKIEISLEQIMKIISTLMTNKEMTLLAQLVGDKRVAAIECLYHQNFKESLVMKTLQIPEDFAWDFVSLIMRFRRVITDQQIELMFLNPGLIKVLYHTFNTLFQQISEHEGKVEFVYLMPEEYLCELNSEDVIDMAYTKLSSAKEFAFALHWLNSHGILQERNIHLAHSLNENAMLLEQINIKVLLEDEKNLHLPQILFENASRHIINNLQKNRLINRLA